MAVDAAPAVEVRKKLTPDDVWDMVCRGELEDRICELVEGELIDLPPAGDAHETPTGNVYGPLWNFARENGGRAFASSMGYRVGAGLNNVREADASYVSPERVHLLDGRFLNGAPDLAVEVLSRGQYGRAYAQGKVQEYFAAGAQLVWLVDYRRKEVRVFRPNSDTYTIMRGDAELSLEPIIAGFSLKVADIFS